MIGKAIYTFLFFIFLPTSLLLFFKPQMWQDLYSRFYLSKLESKGNFVLKIIFKSLLSLISTDAGLLIHKALGILLGMVTIWIFFEKLKIFSF